MTHKPDNYLKDSQESAYERDRERRRRETEKGRGEGRGGGEKDREVNFV